MNSIPLLLSFLLFFACDKEKSNGNGGTTEAAYDSIPVIKPVLPIINEVSGIADSKLNAGFIWAQEDSGNPPNIFLIKHDGTVLKSIHIKGAQNRDWEDMVLANNDLYIADIGDNNKAFSECTIYRFPEPSSSTDTVKNSVAIRFQYPDGAHDAEAFLVDAAQNIYVITKSDNPSNIYKLSFPYSTTALNNLTLVGKLSYSGVVSAALSPDAKEIIVKTYLGLNRYARSSNETIEQALLKAPKKLPYIFEPQGEAVCFAINNTGYYTLSEKGFGNAVNLYFYKRK